VSVPRPSDTQVLLRVEAAAICGTDLDEVRLGPITVPVRPHPVSGRSAPITLGHEIVGVVVEAGSGSGVAIGARVAPWPSQPCGRCRDCVAGHANRCAFGAALGMSADGGMADFLVVERSRCVPVDAGVELERAVLVEPFAVALRGVRQVELAGLRVAVVGIGSLGLCVVEAAIRAGAELVIAVSRSEAARDAAREAGATATVALEQAGDLDADVVFETAGAAQAVTTSFAAVRRGGRILVLGGHPRPTDVDLLDLTVREVVLQGSVSHCFADFVAAADSINAGDLARVRREVELAPLESGPALLRAEPATAKRILVPGL
jgi:(R,R)-butanediol dehydrogenase/meso-butanediol dehydrogenase/diacetyl reductase